MAVPVRTAALPLLWRTLRSGTRLAPLPAMVADSARGRYTGVGRSRLAWAAVGLTYLVSPVDALPEAWLPLVGLLDDGVVATWVAGSVLVATEDYAAWRSGDGHPRVHRRRRV